MGTSGHEGRERDYDYCPDAIKKKQMQEVLDKEGRPVLNENGDSIMKEVEVKIPRFKAITVFDIAQTVGDPIDLMVPEELKEAVNDYDLFMKQLPQYLQYQSDLMRFQEMRKGTITMRIKKS